MQPTFPHKRFDHKLVAKSVSIVPTAASVLCVCVGTPSLTNFSRMSKLWGRTTPQSFLPQPLPQNKNQTWQMCSEIRGRWSLDDVILPTSRGTSSKSLFSLPPSRLLVTTRTPSFVTFNYSLPNYITTTNQLNMLPRCFLVGASGRTLNRFTSGSQSFWPRGQTFQFGTIWNVFVILGVECGFWREGGIE